MNSIGIDIGSSTIKIISCQENKIINKNIYIKENSNQAFEKFIEENKINLNEISNICVTGIGAHSFEEKYNILVNYVEEFEAIKNGGLSLAHKKEAIVVSIGTGTALIRVNNGETKHIGGTGVGAGTLVNLCKKFTGISTFQDILESSKKGNLDNIDLKIKDVSKNSPKTLPQDLTLSNFGKLNENATKDDIVIGIINMVFETIGMMAAFATINDTVKQIILVGNIVSLPSTKKILRKIEETHKVEFIIPENPQYAVAYGAISKL